MRRNRAWAVAIGVVVVLLGSPWVLSWAFIHDPTPDEVRELAEPLLARNVLMIHALDDRGDPLGLAPEYIAAFTPGPCLRDHETESLSRRIFEVRVTHWCRIDLRLQDSRTAMAGFVRNQWVGDPPDGLSEDALLAEPHELRVLADRLGR